MDDKAISTTEACKKLGVCKTTLLSWVQKGKIDYYRTPTGRRYYYIDKYLQSTNKISKCIIYYSRVSSRKQRDDLERQKEYIKNFVPNEQSGLQVLEYSDIASGINFRRKSLLQVLGLVQKGSVSTIVVASKDRLARFGFELIEWICNEHGTEIVVLDSECKTREEEFSDDILSILQVYCCRWNGKRRYKKETNNQNIQIEITSK